MKRLVVGFCLAAIGTPVFGENADQFDLVCKAQMKLAGVARDGSIITTGKPPTDLGELRYTLDLTRKEWCPVNRCATDGANRIIEVTSTTIVLQDEPRRKSVINRTDGTLTSTSTTGDIIMLLTGTCRKEAFTPMSTARF